MTIVALNAKFVENTSDMKMIWNSIRKRNAFEFTSTEWRTLAPFCGATHDICIVICRDVNNNNNTECVSYPKDHFKAIQNFTRKKGKSTKPQ